MGWMFMYDIYDADETKLSPGIWQVASLSFIYSHLIRSHVAITAFAVIHPYINFYGRALNQSNY